MSAGTVTTAPTQEELVKRIAIERFLQKDADEVERLMDQDGLPYLRLPGRTAPGSRFFLPAFHAWLLKHARGDCESLRDYAVFLRAFNAAQVAGKRGRKVPSEQ